MIPEENETSMITDMSSMRDTTRDDKMLQSSPRDSEIELILTERDTNFGPTFAGLRLGNM